MNNLAEMYLNSGRFSKALPLFQEALELAKELYGDNNLIVATINSNLGNLFQSTPL